MMPFHFAGYANNWWCGPGTFFSGPLGLLFPLLFWGLIGFVALKIIGVIFPRRTNHTGLDILKKRYANGEINIEEFHRIKNDLQ